MAYYKDENVTLFLGDCVNVLRCVEEKSVDMIFADPPYRLSNNGITCKSGKIASVNKGDWDRTGGFKNDHEFNKKWLYECYRVLSDDGTIWISGTYHIIHSIAFALLELGYYIINEIIWFKPNAAPNISCKCFTASHEVLIWAKKSKKTKHKFNYSLMKELNGGKQMRSVWEIPTTPKREKTYGIHPTQKPKQLLYRCIMSCTEEGDIVLDPFCGSGTTGVIAVENQRRFIGIEINEEYLKIAKNRILQVD